MKQKIGKSIVEKKGIIRQISLGFWFLFWSLGIVWLVYKLGFVPMFAAILIVGIILIVILGRITTENKTNNDN